MVATALHLGLFLGFLAVLARAARVEPRPSGAIAYAQLGLCELHRLTRHQREQMDRYLDEFEHGPDRS